MNRIKQEALASMVGVSHAAVSQWENGHSRPSKRIALRLSDVMIGMHTGMLSNEVLFIAPLQQIKALIRGRRLQLVGVSSGFGQLWPETMDLLGKDLRDLLVNEAAIYCNENDYLREATAGEILMVTGVSNRFLAVGETVDPHHRVRWHAIVRRIDGELIHEVIYEPCDPGTDTGFEKILRRSDIGLDFD